jgi:hypothetical protein
VFVEIGDPWRAKSLMRASLAQPTVTSPDETILPAGT